MVLSKRYERIFPFALVIEFSTIIKHESYKNIEVIITQNKKVAQEWSRSAGNRQRKSIDLTSYTSTEKWKLFESITHVHINLLGTTPLLYLSFMLISAYFVEVLLKSCLNVLLKLFHTGDQCRISAISYNQMSPTQDIQMFLMQRYICPCPMHNQTLIETSKAF